MDEIKDTIRQYILSNHLSGEPSESLRDDTPLQTGGILDSLAILNLVLFIEDRFEIQLDVYDTSGEHFDRIDHIAACVARKQAPRAS